jgi:hypothetical protein
MSKNIQVSKENLNIGYKILEEISSFRPYSSISFQSSGEIISAVQEVKGLADWGMAKNKHKMKASVINTLDSILSCDPEEPVNLNLTKYELESIKALSKLVKRALDQQKDGVVLV